MTRPTLVLLPGLLNTARVFEPLIAELGDAADVVVPELHPRLGLLVEPLDGLRVGENDDGARQARGAIW